jgi:hypothetical protein
MNTLTEDDFKKLNQRVLHYKMTELFEEPCPLYEEDDEELTER